MPLPSASARPDEGIEKTTQTDGSLAARGIEAIQEAMPSNLALFSTDIDVDLSRAARFPLGEIASLGTAFVALPEAFRTVTQTITLPGIGLLQATDGVGNPIATSALQAFRDGSGLLGSTRDAATGFAQVRLHEVASQTASVATTMPYDPGTLAMAIALMEINRKLDAIQETQKELFEYVRNKDKAELRGNLETLFDVLENYRFHWNNPQYKNNKHILVQSIRNSAEKTIIQHWAEIKGRLKKAGIARADRRVREKVNAVRSELEEYRIAVYLYAFASFLEVMLLESFEADYLAGVAKKIDNHSISYRELYTQAYDLIDADADGSLRAMALGGLSETMGLIGKAIGGTPVGKLTSIDDALQDASRELADLNEDMKSRMMSRLTDARSSDVRPFVESIERVSSLYNEPALLLADSEAVYLLPAGDGAAL